MAFKVGLQSQNRERSLERYYKKTLGLFGRRMALGGFFREIPSDFLTFLRICTMMVCDCCCDRKEQTAFRQSLSAGSPSRASTPQGETESRT